MASEKLNSYKNGMPFLRRFNWNLMKLMNFTIMTLL